MKYYVVLSPKYEIIDPVLDFGQGPSEECRDYVYVRAKNKREAKVIGLQFLRQLKTAHKWYGENPFKEMELEEITKYRYCKYNGN